MKQEAFIQRLRQELSRLPKQVIDEIVWDYREYIGDALAAGRTEDEVVAALGDPRRLGRELRAQANYRQWEKRRSFGNLIRVVGSIAGLGLLHIILLAPFMLYLLVLTFGYVVSTTLGVAGLVAVVGLGSHYLFGWPAFNALPINVSSNDHKHVRYAGDSDSEVHEDDADEDVTDAQDGTKVLNAAGDCFLLNLENGDKVAIVTTAGSIELRKDDGKIVISTPNEGARALISRGNDDSLSIARSVVTTLDINQRNGGRLLIARAGKDSKSTVWDVTSAGKKHVRFVQDEHGNAMHLEVQRALDSVVIDNSQISIDNGKHHLHVSAPEGSTLTGIAFRYSCAMLAGGVLGLLLCFWLTRCTWRSLTRYVKWQIDLVSAKLEHEETV